MGGELIQQQRQQSFQRKCGSCDVLLVLRFVKVVVGKSLEDEGEGVGREKRGDLFTL